MRDVKFDATDHGGQWSAIRRASLVALVVLCVAALWPASIAVSRLAHSESVQVWCAYGIPKRVTAVRIEWQWSRLNYDCVFSDANGRDIARKHAPTRPPWNGRPEPVRSSR